MGSVILQDLQKIRQEIVECDEKESAKKSEIAELESHHSEKLQELEKLKVICYPHCHKPSERDREHRRIHKEVQRRHCRFADPANRRKIEHAKSFFFIFL